MKALNEEQKKRLGTTGAIAAAACVAVWILYQYVLVGLYLGPRDNLASKIAKAKKTEQDNVVLVKTAANDSKIWTSLAIQDLRAKPQALDQTSAMVWDTISQIASNAGMTIIDWKDGGSHPSSGRLDFVEVRFIAETRTTTGRLAGFLQAVETNNAFPARIDGLNVHAITPGQDDLKVEITLSALVYNPKTPLTTRPAGTQSKVGNVPAVVRNSSTMSAAPEATPDMAAMEAQLIKKRQEEAARLAKERDEQEAILKLPPEQQAAALAKVRAAQEAAATQKAADDAAKAAQMEAEMIRRREQDVGATTAPGGAK